MDKIIFVYLSLVLLSMLFIADTIALGIGCAVLNASVFSTCCLFLRGIK